MPLCVPNSDLISLDWGPGMLSFLNPLRWSVFSSFSLTPRCSVSQSDFLRSLGLQHTKLPCPSPSPGSCSNSCPLSQWCHPTSHPLSYPSPPAFNLSQHQGLFQWVSSLHQVVKVLELQLQHQSFQWIFSWFPLGLTSLIFSNTTVQKHQPSLCSTLTSIHDYSKNHSFDYMVLCWQNNVSAF